MVHKLDSRPDRMWDRVDMVRELALVVIFAVQSTMVWSICIIRQRKTHTELKLMLICRRMTSRMLNTSSLLLSMLSIDLLKMSNIDPDLLDLSKVSNTVLNPSNIGLDPSKTLNTGLHLLKMLNTTLLKTLSIDLHLL